MKVNCPSCGQTVEVDEEIMMCPECRAEYVPVDSARPVRAPADPVKAQQQGGPQPHSHSGRGQEERSEPSRHA
jgi:hypothetical protein